MTGNKVTTLLVGLGGIGCKIAESTYKMIPKEDREYIGAVGVDTDIEDLKALSIEYIQTSDNRSVKEFLRDYPDYVNWFPVNKYLLDKKISTGAGQIRALSRMAMLASIDSNKFRPMEEEISRILRHNGQTEPGHVNVYLMGSITGGTGAGLFLQMPYYIRRILKDQMGINNITVKGLFLSADLTMPLQPSNINREAMQVNAYACIKELNALYLTQEDTNHYTDNIRFDFYERDKEDQKWVLGKIKDNKDDLESMFFDQNYDENERYSDDINLISEEAVEIPYDAFYLIEGSDNTGTVGTADIETVITHASKMLFTSMFTPIKSSEEGVEINYVLADMEGGGMGRFSSMGLTTMKYPYEQILEYVALRWTADLVTSDWILLDEHYEQERLQAEKTKRSDSSVKVPKLKDVFIREFDKHTQPGKGHKLGHLREEAFMEGGSTSKGKNRADVFLRRVEDRIESFFDEPEISSLAEVCESSGKKLRNLDTAAKEINRVEEAIKEYLKAVETLIASHRIQVANEVFPTSMDAMNYSRDAELNIVNLISSIHPVSARFILYSLINKLEERISVLETQAERLNLDELDQDNYSVEKGVKADAAEAVAKMQDKGFAKIRARGSGKGSLKRLASKYAENSEASVERIKDYGKDSIKLCTFEVLRERLIKISEYYEVFFRSMKEKMLENKGRIESLESDYSDVQPVYGVRPIFASREAFRHMYELFVGSQTEVGLPKETSSRVFDKVYQIAVSALEDDGQVLSEKTRRDRNAKYHDELLKLFKTGIYETLYTGVQKKGGIILDMTARQALEKEFQMETGMKAELDPGYDSELAEYERRELERAMKEANPMIAVQRIEDPKVTAYLAFHPDSANSIDGEPNAGITREQLFPDSGEATEYVRVSALMDEKFSRHELICMRTKHKYQATDLLKYGKGSEYEKQYWKRIRMLGKKPEIYGEEAYKTVANPHIDRNWSEEGCIPSLSAHDRVNARKEEVSAFIHAVGHDENGKDWLVYDGYEDDNGKIVSAWTYRCGYTSRIFLIYSMGRLVANNYAELYRSMKHNGRIKRMILAHAKEYTRAYYKGKSPDTIIKEVLDDPFVEDLSQASEADEEDMNIMDLALIMREGLRKDEWDFFVNGIGQTLMDYFEDIFDKNGRMINAAYQKSIIHIIRHSNISKAIKEKKDNDIDLSEGEKDLLEHWKTLGNKKYQ